MFTILDTRDLEPHLIELQELKDDYEDSLDELKEAQATLDGFCFQHTDDTAKTKETAAEFTDAVEEAKLRVAAATLGTEDAKELSDLAALKDEIGGVEWARGTILVPEDDFEAYCQEFCEGDLKALPEYIVVDWKASSVLIRANYTEIEFQGATYLYRT
jgi:glycine/D-amino acid oxidase-like deaminating enzyme